MTKLLGFDLLPRIKRINKCKLYRPRRRGTGAVAGRETSHDQTHCWRTDRIPVLRNSVGRSCELGEEAVQGLVNSRAALVVMRSQLIRRTYAGVVSAWSRLRGRRRRLG